MSQATNKSSNKTIIFDADGTVLRTWGFAKHLEREYGVTPEIAAGFFHGSYLECQEGRADLREVMPPLLEEWGWRGTLDHFLSTWFIYDSDLDIKVMEAVQELRKRPVRCCLAANQERYRAEYLRTRLGLGSEFDHVFFSFELGHRKPSPGFFAGITDALQQDPSDIILIDNNKADVEAASAFGWRAFHYLGLGRLTPVLERVDRIL